MDETYDLTVECENCFTSQQVHIPLGQSFYDSVRFDMRCSYCGSMGSHTPNRTLTIGARAINQAMRQA